MKKDLISALLAPAMVYDYKTVIDIDPTSKRQSWFKGMIKRKKHCKPKSKRK